MLRGCLVVSCDKTRIIFYKIFELINNQSVNSFNKKGHKILGKMTARTLSKSFPFILHGGVFSTDESVSMEELKEYYSELFQDDFFVNTKIIGTRIMDTSDERYTV